MSPTSPDNTAFGQLLQSASSFNDVLCLLNTDAKYPISSRKLLYQLKNSARLYASFEIPKKTGGIRTINAPQKTLKFIQKRFAVALQQLSTPSPSANAYIAERSIVTNAKVHVQKKYVLNLDLENFFPSISIGRVVTVLQLPPLRIQPKVASMIAKLCCYEDSLPQGAPTSPVLSNVICQRLDRRIESLVRSHAIVYTRYADDLTFSSDEPFQNGFLSHLDSIIKEEGFTINLKKVRLQLQNSRQEVTGVTVNEKVNVPQRFIREIRAMLHNWETLGYEAAQQKFLIHYLPKKPGGNGEAQLCNVVAGKINYLKMVRGGDDPVYQKLKDQLRGLESRGYTLVPVAKSRPAWRPTVEHNPRRVVGFLRNFRVVNDTGFRELLHDPDVSDFDFMANLTNVNAQMEGLRMVLTPRLHQKLSAFVKAYNTAGVAYFQKYGLLPLKGRPKQTVSPLAKLLLKKANLPIADLKDELQEAVSPDKTVSKAAEKFRPQIRVGSDYFQDLILANALKRTLKLLNANNAVSASFRPSEEDFGVNCSFFTDAWEARDAIRSLLKDLAQNTDYQTSTESRTLWLRSAVIQRGTEQAPFFATVIYVHLEKASIQDLKAFSHQRLEKTKQRLWSLADWSVLYQDTNGQNQEHFFLNSADNQPHPAPWYEGITHKLTFYHS
jgi:RNA-directed DNA polymerase